MGSFFLSFSSAAALSLRPWRLGRGIAGVAFAVLFWTGDPLFLVNSGGCVSAGNIGIWCEDLFRFPVFGISAFGFSLSAGGKLKGETSTELWRARSGMLVNRCMQDNLMQSIYRSKIIEIRSNLRHRGHVLASGDWLR